MVLPVRASGGAAKVALMPIQVGAQPAPTPPDIHGSFRISRCRSKTRRDQELLSDWEQYATRALRANYLEKVFVRVLNIPFASLRMLCCTFLMLSANPLPLRRGCPSWSQLRQKLDLL